MKPETFVKQVISQWSRGRQFTYSIIEINENSLIGMINLVFNPTKTRAQIGYVLAKTHWNQGLTTEAVKTLIRETFLIHQTWRVQAFCNVGNPASARVMQKSGMQLEGKLKKYLFLPNQKEQITDAFLYAITKQST